VLRDLGSDATVSQVIVARDLANLAEAVAAVKAADTVIIMAGVVATEGADRPSADMPDDQNRMMDALLGLNPRTIVVLKDSSPVLMPWIAKAPAILEAWNQGAEDGHVVPDLLFGVVNPSGKVPTTYPASEKDTLYYNDPVRYPGTDEGGGFPVIRYTEGLQVGYRWFQAQGIKPLFPFGFGLSYTTFEISDLAVSGAESDGAQAITVEFTVANTGKVAGAEVGQVYLGIPVAGQPPKRLVGFKKVHLQPGQSQRVSLVIDPAATNHPLSVWDYCTRSFVVKPGDYTVYVGNSSENTPLTATVTVG
jgi:beta-glucosidase